MIGHAALALALAVVDVIGATSDVHDALAVGDDVVAATSGGVVVVQGVAPGWTIGARQGLPGSRVRSLSRVDAGVWIGTVDGAVLVDAVALVSPGANPTIRRRLRLRRVERAIAWQGETWFASHGDGLYRLAGTASARPRQVKLGRQRNRLTDIVVVGDELWVATAGRGIARVDARGALAGTIERRHGLPSNIVWQLIVDGDRVLAATSGGIAVVAGGKVARRAPLAIRSSELPVRDVRSLALGPAGEITAVTFGGGAFRFASETSSPQRLGGDGAARGRVAVAVAGEIWIGHDRGLDLVHRRELIHVIQGGLHSPDVTCLAHAFGALWIGTFSDGLARRDAAGRVDEVTAARDVDTRINDLAVTRGRDGRERLWIATDRGLWWHDGDRFERASGDGAPADVHVTALHVDAGGALWVASSRTLSRLRNGSWQAWTGDAQTPVLQLHAVTTDPDGQVWAGSLHGLLELSPDDGSIRHHTVASGALAVDWVTAVAAVDGGIVAGTYHGGLSWRRGGTWKLERETRNGLPAGWINPHAIRVDGDRLWLGTLDRGLVVGRSGKWRRLTIADGLPGNDVTAIAEASGGTMWVATRAGLARVSVEDSGRRD